MTSSNDAGPSRLPVEVPPIGAVTGIHWKIAPDEVCGGALTLSYRPPVVDGLQKGPGVQICGRCGAELYWWAPAAPARLIRACDRYTKAMTPKGRA